MPAAWAPDEFSPLHVYDAIARRFSRGWYELYPPMHVYVLALVLAPFKLLEAAGVLETRNPGPYLAAYYAIRLTSVAMGVGIVVAVFAITRELYDTRSAVLAALSAALVSQLTYYAKIANVDVPYTLWLLLSLYSAIRIAREPRFGDYLGFATFAAFAIGTKDQAGAFYPLIPLLLVGAAYRRAQVEGHRRPLVAALGDRRLLIAGAYGLALLAAIHNLALNWSGAAERIQAITGPMTTQMQEFANTPRGHLEMIALGIRHVQFALGWPLFGVTVVGTFTAIARLRHDTRPLFLLLPIVSYWVFLIVPILYHFDRYFLPVVVLLTVFAGPVLAWLTTRAAWRQAGPLVAVLVLAYTAVYASSVNALMDADGRYAAEAWLEANVPGGSRIMAVGYAMYLPRLDGPEVTITPRPSLEELQARGPDYLVLTSAFDQRRFEPHTAEAAFFRALHAGTGGYAEVFWSRGRPRWNLLGPLRRVRSNFDKINPAIAIYARSSRAQRAAGQRRSARTITGEPNARVSPSSLGPPSSRSASDADPWRR